MNYSYDDNTQISQHFNVKEFRCKCGKNHDTEIDTALVNKLEQLYSHLDCSKIIITSGYRCSAHDKAVGGNGTGMHTKGVATDICCYGQDGKPISSKKVCCSAQDIGFTGIANIDNSYQYTHVDVRSGNTWFGDEVVTTSYSVCNDFYSYFKIPKSDESLKSTSTKCIQLTVDGVTYSGILTKI